jgi:hypothetical protein
MQKPVHHIIGAGEGRGQVKHLPIQYLKKLQFKEKKYTKITSKVKKLSLCLKKLIKHYAMKAYGSGYIDPHFLDLGTSWR